MGHSQVQTPGEVVVCPHHYHLSLVSVGFYLCYLSGLLLYVEWASLLLSCLLSFSWKLLFNFVYSSWAHADNVVPLMTKGHQVSSVTPHLIHLRLDLSLNPELGCFVLVSASLRDSPFSTPQCWDYRYIWDHIQLSAWVLGPKLLNQVFLVVLQALYIEPPLYNIYNKLIAMTTL